MLILTEDAYNSLAKVYLACKSKLKAGNQMKDIYQEAINTINQVAPQFKDHLTKNVGFGLSMQFRTSGMILNAKNTKLLKGMILIYQLVFILYHYKVYIMKH